MKIDKTHIEKIKSAFEKMQTKDDLLDLLNFAKPLVYGEKAKPFELRQLTWHANPKVNKKRYVEFTIAKKSGGVRTINAPNSGLKSIQKTLVFILQCVFEPHKAAHGFVRNKSIVDNAKLHVGQNYVYNIDLRDFFPSIDQARVWKCLQLRPFNLNKEYSTPVRWITLDDFLVKYCPGKTTLQLKNANDIFDLSSISLGEKKTQARKTIKKSPLIKDDTLRFYKWKERYACETPYGVIYTSKNYDNDKPRFIILGNDKIKTRSGKSIEDSIWLVNKVPNENRLDLANLISALCCTELEVERKSKNGDWEKVSKNVLPQGAPTSPVITNVICQRLDFYLTAVAKRFNLKYSRYADDITFSSMHNVYQKDGEFLAEIQRIITEQGFHIKESKTRLQKQGYRQEVTGITVNERPNLQLNYIKQLRMWLYYWETYGFDKANSYFLQQYAKDKGHLMKGQANMINVIAGKLDYLKMVRGGQSRVYMGLKERFEILISKNQKEIIESQGIKTLISENVLSKLENGNYIVEIKKSTLKIKVFKENIIVIDDAGKGFEKVSSILNDAYKFNIKLPEFCKIYKIENKTTTLLHEDKETLPRLEDKVNKTVLEKTSKNENSDISVSRIPNIHSPKELVLLLKNFSVNDSALKYTTHSWDAGRDAKMFKDLSEFLKVAESQYRKFSFQLNSLSKNLHGKINTFLFDKEIAKKGWGDINPKKRIYFGWSSPELLEACNNDISLNPEDFILPEKYQIKRSGKTLQKFKHIIDVFKNEIEIRDENSALLNLILQKHDLYLISFSTPKVSNLENKTFYTDIQWLGKALDLIFEGIQKYPQHPFVEYAVTESNNDRLVLTILHRNSFKNGLSIYDDKLNLKRGDFSTIKDKLRNLCDWCIESEFSEGAYRINYLVSDNEIPAYEKIMSAEGFKHILTFYK